MGSNLILIGMPGAGKSTIGVLLARQLGYSFLDTDLLIQERQGKRVLQEVVNEMGQDAFRAYEEAVCLSLEATRTVIATGGSVVYFPPAMRHLSDLGPIAWLDVPFPEVEKRVAQFPDRGLAIRPDQTLSDLYSERAPLYERYADLHIECGLRPPVEIVKETVSALKRMQGEAIDDR